jgi:hypothetical protein
LTENEQTKINFNHNTKPLFFIHGVANPFFMSDTISKRLQADYSEESIDLAVKIIDKHLKNKSYREIKEMSFLLMKVAEDLCKN